MYYINLSGGALNVGRNLVNPWEHVDLPDDLYDYIRTNVPGLEIDYPRYASEIDAQDRYGQEFYEHIDSIHRDMRPRKDDL